MELKDLYDSFVIQAKPQDLGLQMNRQRVYIILHPKKKNAIVDDPSAIYKIMSEYCKAKIGSVGLVDCADEAIHNLLMSVVCV